jgi:hypothetical protein
MAKLLLLGGNSASDLSRPLKRSSLGDVNGMCADLQERSELSGRPVPQGLQVKGLTGGRINLASQTLQGRVQQPQQPSPPRCAAASRCSYWILTRYQSFLSRKMLRIGRQRLLSDADCDTGRHSGCRYARISITNLESPGESPLPVVCRS